MNEIPRRNRLDLMTPAELAVTEAIREVEKLQGDIELTNAVIKLMEARDHIANFVDKKQNNVSK